MNITIDTFTLSTKEAGAKCATRGGEVIFEELVAVYHHKGLKPLRTLPNGVQHWSTETVMNFIRLAQAEEALSDRARVEAALAQWRKLKAIK